MITKSSKPKETGGSDFRFKCPGFSKNHKHIKKLENMEKAMAAHSSTFAWKIPWTEEPDRLQSMGS